MRIAIIAVAVPPHRHGGAEAYVRDLSVALAHRDEIFLLTGSPGTPSPDVRGVQLDAEDEVRHDASPIGKAWWHLRDQWRPKVFLELLRHLGRFRPDVVHTHNVQGLSASVFSAIHRLSLPHVHTVHDLSLICLRASMTRGGEPCGGRCVDCRLQRMIRARAAGASVDRLIAPSDFVRERHVEYGVTARERCSTIRQGVEPGSARLRIPRATCIRIGFIGALTAYKGVHTLLAAFKLLPSTFRLSIAGAGILEPAVRGAAATDSRIVFHGHIGASNREAFYDALDLIVIPSEWEETAPLVATEAAIRGLPAVVSDRGGLPETPEARVFEARDPRALAAAIEWYAREPGRLTAASERLLARRDEFQWQAHVSAVRDVLSAAAVAP